MIPATVSEAPQSKNTEFVLKAGLGKPTVTSGMVVFAPQSEKTRKPRLQESGLK